MHSVSIAVQYTGIPVGLYLHTTRLASPHASPLLGALATPRCHQTMDKLRRTITEFLQMHLQPVQPTELPRQARMGLLLAQLPYRSASWHG